MPKTEKPGGRAVIRAARVYRERQKFRHRNNMARAMFKWLARGGG